MNSLNWAYQRMQLVKVASRPHDVHAGRREDNRELTQSLGVLVVAVESRYDKVRHEA